MTTPRRSMQQSSSVSLDRSAPAAPGDAIHAQDTAQFQLVLRRNLMLPLGVGAVSAFVFVALIAYLLGTITWVEHTQRVLGGANQLTTLTADLETGTRGFLLTGDESFLAPYNVGKPKLVAQMEGLVLEVADNPPQVDRLRRIQQLQLQWDAIADRLIQARRQARPYDELVRSQAGKQLFDEMRREFAAFTAAEESLLKERSDTSRAATVWTVVLYVMLTLLASGLIAMIGRRQMVAVSDTFGSALSHQRLAAERLEQQAWLRAGQAQLSDRLIGQLTLPMLGEQSLAFLADYFGAVVAALYVRTEGGRLERVAGYGFGRAQATPMGSHALLPDEGLAAQVARDGKVRHLDNLPQGYLKVTSGLGDGPVSEIIVAPTVDGGQVNGVVEIGFLRPVQPRDLSLLEMLATPLGAAVEAAQYRHRLQQSLEETRQLNEEMQVQQEELRAANEELAEHATVLMTAQSDLENQQAELEGTNSELARQAAELDARNDALRQAQADLQQHADELQRASRYKSEFLANMSHELRTPLNSSLILAKLLSENKPGNLNDEQLKFANIIYSAGNDLLTLINDILDLSKVEAGKLELNPAFVPVSALVRSLQYMFTPLAVDKALAFSVTVEPGVPASMFTDSQRVEQVCKNLLSNAIKFTEAGSVSMRVEPRGADRVAFVVTDTGIGISADQQAAVFEAFKQADGTINRRYGGTGLGLSISRELASLLGGDIEVASEPGRGSRFTFTLPSRWTTDIALPPGEADERPNGSVPGRPSTADGIGRPASPPDRQAPFAPTERGSPPSIAFTDGDETSAGTAGASPAATASFADDRDDTPAGRRTVLVIEDDPTFASILFDLAHERQYRCLVAHGAEEGFQLAVAQVPHAILLDIRLPDRSGLSVLQQLKEHARTRHIPVHIVAGEDLRDVALNMGAVGFAMKPASVDQLKEVFAKLEQTGASKVKRVLLVEDDARQRESVVHLIGDDDVRIDAVASGREAMALLRDTVFDCMIIDLKLPDMDGSELLERMTAEQIAAFPPVIVYTGRNLTRDEEASLNRYSRSIIIKGARSPERLLDEVTLFLHKVESELSSERQSMLATSRSRDHVFEGRKVLLVDDDVRNIFALSSALEQRGLTVEIARNGFEAIDRLQAVADIDLVLMDVMMPGMDGLEATRRIRDQPRFRKLPIIAITAKAMKDDQEQCRSAGMNDYLAKPIDLPRLFSLMRVWMPSIERL